MKFKKILMSLILSGFILMGCTQSTNGNLTSNTNSEDNTMELKILATTDVHNYLMNYDYYTSMEADNYGLVKLSTLIKKYKLETPEVEDFVIVDNGDLIQGNPFGDFFNQVSPVENGTTHPIYDIFEKIGYDVLGLGNHEFNYGIDYLHQIIEDTRIPVINSNVFNAKTNQHEFTPYVVLNKQVVDENGKVSDIKVGILNVVPEQILVWDKLLLDGKIVVQDMKESVEENVKILREEEGADIVVALAHTGYGSENYVKGSENIAAALTKVKGLDVVIAGHSHQEFPSENSNLNISNVNLEKGTINNVVTVQPGKYGEVLGVVSLKLSKDENGKFSVVDGKSENVKAVDVENDKEIEDLLSPYHEQVIDYVSKPVGQTLKPITSFFALVSDSESTQIVSDAQLKHVKKLVETQPELSQYKNLPILSVVAPFKTGYGGADDYVDIEVGGIAIKDVSNLYKYANTVTILKLTGKEIKEWLEMSAGNFNQIEEGKEGQELLAKGFSSFNFDTIDGVTYEIDITQPSKYDPSGKIINPSSERIVNLQFNGSKIDEAQEFLVVTNNYRAGGGGNFPIFTTGNEIVYTSVDESRQVVSNYIASQGEFSPAADNNWRLKPVQKETKIKFISSSKGEKFLNSHPAITKVKDIENGLAEYVYDLSVSQ